MTTGNAYPQQHSVPNVYEVTSLFACAGTTLNMTKVYGNGIASVVRTADGKFTVTFTPGFFGAALLHAEVEVHTVAAAAPLKAKVNWATYSASAGTVDIEVWDLATPSLAIPASTAKCCLNFKFIKTTS